MSLSNTPVPFKGGLVLLDPSTFKQVKTISLQFNPETVKRSLKPQDMGAEGNGRSDVTRLKGPAIETFSITAELDLNDQIRLASPIGTDMGVQPEISALESLVQPTVAQLLNMNSLASIGTLEIAPPEEPLVVLVLGETRVIAVKVTQFSVEEEIYDAQLNPIVAKVTLELRVLTVADVGFSHKGGNLFMAYLSLQESLAARVSGGRAGSVEGVL